MRCWVRNRDPEPEEKRPLHLKHKTHAHYTNGEKVQSKPNICATFYLWLVSCLLYQLPTGQGPVYVICGKSIEINDKSVHVDTLMSRLKRFLFWS